ncbi:MAG: AAA family ATPase [Propionibacteriaceae bacterium]|nr:AAA family ATPase [Propionibacteriaceae bacterium]
MAGSGATSSASGRSPAGAKKVSARSGAKATSGSTNRAASKAKSGSKGKSAAWSVPRPVRRIQARSDFDGDLGQWPFTIPAIRQLITEGLDFGQATILVGENGSGKSTLVEALAEAYGFNPEGGSTGAMHLTHRTESGLADDLTLSRGPGAARGGYFLRAETMHGLYTYLEEVGAGAFHAMSHGESFLEVIETRAFGRNGQPAPGLYLFDEVESALSFSSSLRVLATLRELLTEERVQIVLATHSPILAALPGATIIELTSEGFRTADWADLELVVNERYFLTDPQRFLRHLAP